MSKPKSTPANQTQEVKPSKRFYSIDRVSGGYEPVEITVYSDGSLSMRSLGAADVLAITEVKLMREIRKNLGL